MNITIIIPLWILSKFDPKFQLENHWKFHWIKSVMNVDALKKKFPKSLINLPFPYPMLLSNPKDNREANRKIVWPFRDQEKFLLITGYLEKFNGLHLILIKDIPSIIALNKMGFFGIHSSKEILPYHQKNRRDHDEHSDNDGNDKLQNHTLGSYSLKSIQIPSAMQNFPIDQNKKIASSTCSQKLSDQEQSKFKSIKLGLEESFFLCWVFGLLRVPKIDDNSGEISNQKFYSIDELWIKFIATDPDPMKFATKFAAYLYLRSQGFVVKNGDKFGVDYSLYEEGPPFNHSRYSVIVRYLVENSENQDSIDFRTVSFLSRLSKNSCKEFLICIVIVPGSLIGLNISNPNIIKHFKIDLITIDRKAII
ncbi:tRNA-splicing endonuclease subunit Sen2 [Sarcoptes scabiei]|uniref:tRNA-intron lyase n=1 Tax=Sarcoptes scabiei TaxID=52283 RepID=A0A834VCV3_SARSC|nr:tRNA-splicing endonuclease subunit Sen2 [Sarcoptes scabiei]